MTIELLGLRRAAGDAEPARPLPLVHVPAAAQARRPRSAGRGPTPRRERVLERRAASAGRPATPAPSSVKSRTPSAAISAIGASWRRPAADGDAPRRRARRSIAPRPSVEHLAATTAASSSGGSVFGMATTAVYPPRAAARAPVSTVSASSRAGLAQVGVEVDQPGRDDAAGRVEHHAPAVEPRRPDGRDHAVLDEDVGASARRSTSHHSDRRRSEDVRPGQRVPPTRAAGTAPPCAPRRRWRPAR